MKENGFFHQLELFLKKHLWKVLDQCIWAYKSNIGEIQQ